MRALLRARPLRMIPDARSADIRNGMGKGAAAVMRLTTKPGQMTLTPTLSGFRTKRMLSPHTRTAALLAL